MARITHYFRVAVLMVVLSKTNGQCVPQNELIRSTQSRQLTVSWQCNDGGTLQQSLYEYEVTSQLTSLEQCLETTEAVLSGSGFSTRTAESAVSGTNLFEYTTTISNLHPYSSYTITITSRISTSPGRTRHIKIHTKTAQEAPSAAPANANVKHLLDQATKTTMKWSFPVIPCGDRGGDISYQVELQIYANNEPANNAEFDYTTSNGIVTVTITGLLCNTLYKFRVRGTNNINDALTGPFTTSFTGMTSSEGSLSVTCLDISQTSSVQISAYSMITVSGGGGSYLSNYNPQLPWNFGAGQNTVVATVTEACYISGMCTFTVTVANPPLSLSCPAPTVTALQGQSNAKVTYQPTVSGGTSPIGSVSCTPISPHEFDVGTHDVSCTVADGASAMATCKFVVVVIATIQIDPPADIDTNSILATRIIFSWSESTCSGSCSVGITGYSYELIATGEELKRGTTGANEKMVTIRGLTPCTEYAFYVAGMSGSVTGTYSSGLRVTTVGKPPGDITGLSLTTPQINSFLIEWEPPSGPCPAETYTIEYRLTNKDQCEPSLGSSRMVGTTDGMPGGPTITGLLSYSTYDVFVRAVNSYGSGPEAFVEGTTQPQEPTAAPSNVRVTSTNLGSLSFSWGEVPCGSRHREITEYAYQLFDEKEMIVMGAYDVTSDRHIEIDSLLMCRTYKFQVRAVGEESGTSPYSESITAITSTSVTNLNAEHASSTELDVSWDAPRTPCTANVEYDVVYRLTNRGQCQPMSDNEVMRESVPGTTVTLSNLYSYSTYEIQVNSSGGVASMTAMTGEAAPSGYPSNVNVMSITNTTAEITWDEPICTERNGNITGYMYSLLEMKSSPSSIVQDTKTTNTMVSFMDLTPSASYTFSISAITNSGSGPSFSVDITTLKTGTDDGAQVSGDPTAAIAGAIAGVIILIILVVIIILLLRRRKNKPKTASGDVPLTEKAKHEPDVPVGSHDNPIMNGSHKQMESVVEPTDIYDEQQEIPKTQTLPAHTRSASTDTEPKRETIYHDMDDDDQMEKSPPKAATLGSNTALVKDKKPIPKPKPIKIENLADYIAKHKANRSEGFNAEFEDIPFGQQHPFMIAKKPNNLPKNRFKNISAYDHSRVILEEIKGVPDSDYINASYVKGYKDELYIAGQGPNKGAMGDIWRMAWDQNSTKIVMLTNLVEDGKRKCEKYWPEKAKVPFVYFPITVRLKDVREYADYEVRDVILEKDEESEPREVRWFHFTAWPDMGVPDYPTPLLNFMKVVKAYEPEGSGLPIVHCSAGVGRTGTYITIDATMKMAHAEGKVDINAIVRKLREDRIKMVQTNKQYEFIYDTVQEALTCGDTGILITNLRQGFQDLQQPIKKGKGKTKLEQQFAILDNLTVVRTKQQCRAGYAAENVDKNRFQDLVPWEKRRPYVMTPGGEGSTNYVNATYLDGYVKKNEFISTQMPLPNTIEDFWRLVYSFKSPTIIMLNGMSNSDPSLGTYWIDSGTLPFTSITVEHVKTKPYMDELTGRTFKIYENDKPKDFITVQQFQFNAWPLGQDTPDSTSALISMIDLMEKWQHQQEKKLGKRPITVHCIDGLGVSGVFCALVSVLEKMKVEKVVDVFQSVKRLRMNRAGMVANLEQYTFLYKAAQVSLEELEIYANFAKTE